MKVADIQRKKDVFVVHVNDGKTGDRQFVVPEPFTNSVEKYIKLRPKKSTSDRFFLTYRKGYCTIMPIGHNIFSDAPKRIASYSGLDEPNRYTGIFCSIIP